MTNEERDALLMRVDERTARMEKWTETHMALHTKLYFAFVASTVSIIIALGTAVVNLLDH